MLLVTRLFDSLPLVMTHDQHDEDMVRHQLQAKRIVKCIGRRRNRSRRTRRRLKQVLPPCPASCSSTTAWADRYRNNAADLNHGSLQVTLHKTNTTHCTVAFVKNFSNFWLSAGSTISTDVRP